MSKHTSIPLQVVVKIDKENNDGSIESRKLILSKRNIESSFHVILKILAYIYFWDHENNLIVEPNYRFKRYKPDLIAFKETELIPLDGNNINLWIECKKVKLKKLLKLSRNLPKSRIYWFHRFDFFEGVKKTLLRKKVVQQHNIFLIGIEYDHQVHEEFTQALFDKQSHWTVIRLADNKFSVKNSENSRIIKYHKFEKYYKTN